MDKIKVKHTCSNCQKQQVYAVGREHMGKTVNLVCNVCNTKSQQRIPSVSDLPAQGKSPAAPMAQNHADDDNPKTQVRFTNIDTHYLEVLANEKTPNQRFELDQKYLTIGRFSSQSNLSDLSVKTADEYMSRKHAILRRQPNGKFTVSDAGSLNKVYLNDTELETGEEVYLQNGDMLKMGRTFFRYVTN
jgi:pSer/pThr/pTyr-binding forkhead associated (FHA) protein